MFCFSEFKKKNRKGKQKGENSHLKTYAFHATSRIRLMKGIKKRPIQKMEQRKIMS